MDFMENFNIFENNFKNKKTKSVQTKDVKTQYSLGSFVEPNVSENAITKRLEKLLLEIIFLYFYIMKGTKEIHLDFEIDKLTNSIENSISGETFLTLIIQIKETKQIKKTEWVFDWHSEVKSNSKSVWSLTTQNNQNIIQGLISITDKGDHIFMDLIESAKFNKGKNKLYKGVAGNLVAFACKTSFEKGYGGIESFIAKTQLIDHYTETLGAKIFGRNRMYIDTREAKILTTKYFKNFKT